MRSLTTLLYGVTLLASLITAPAHVLALQAPTADQDEPTVADPSLPESDTAAAGASEQIPTPTPSTDTTGTEDAPIRVELSLDEAIILAIGGNLSIRTEFLTRRRTREEITIAAAVFDPLFTTSYTNNKFRQPTVDTLSGLSGVGLLTEVNVNPFVSQSLSFGFSGLTPIGTQWSLTAGGNRGDNPASQFFGINPRNDTFVRAEFTQPLLKNFGFDANLADLRRARNSDEIASFRLRRLMETTIDSVHQAYWDLVLAREDLNVKIASLEEATELLTINRQRVAVGSAKEIDVIDAEANIETQKSGIIDSENALRQAQDTLLDLLNYNTVLREQHAEYRTRNSLYEGVTVIPTTSFEPEPLTIDMEDAIGRALAQRNDLRQNELEVINAELDLKRRKNQLLPTLNITGTWNQLGLEENIGNSIDELGSGRFYNWTVGVNVEVPIGNRSERSLLRQAMVDLESRRVAAEQLRNSIILEVTQAVRDIDSTYQRVLTTRAASRLRKEQLQGEEERLKVGASTSYQVLQVQNDMLEAQLEEVRARIEFRRAQTRLDSALGEIFPAGYDPDA